MAQLPKVEIDFKGREFFPEKFFEIIILDSSNTALFDNGECIGIVKNVCDEMLEYLKSKYFIENYCHLQGIITSDAVNSIEDFYIRAHKLKSVYVRFEDAYWI